MKALQKNQGRTDQLLGAMADVLTSVAIPNQQWVSCRPVCVFTGRIVALIHNQSESHMWRLFLGACGARCPAKV